MIITSLIWFTLFYICSLTCCVEPTVHFVMGKKSFGFLLWLYLIGGLK